MKMCEIEYSSCPLRRLILAWQADKHFFDQELSFGDDLEQVSKEQSQIFIGFVDHDMRNINAAAAAYTDKSQGGKKHIFVRSKARQMSEINFVLK